MAVKIIFREPAPDVVHVPGDSPKVSPREPRDSITYDRGKSWTINYGDYNSMFDIFDGQEKIASWKSDVIEGIELVNDEQSD